MYVSAWFACHYTPTSKKRVDSGKRNHQTPKPTGLTKCNPPITKNDITPSLWKLMWSQHLQGSEAITFFIQIYFHSNNNRACQNHRLNFTDKEEAHGSADWCLEQIILYQRPLIHLSTSRRSFVVFRTTWYQAGLLRFLSNARCWYLDSIGKHVTEICEARQCPVMGSASPHKSLDPVHCFGCIHYHLLFSPIRKCQD